MWCWSWVGHCFPCSSDFEVYVVSVVTTWLCGGGPKQPYFPHTYALTLLSRILRWDYLQISGVFSLCILLPQVDCPANSSCLGLSGISTPSPNSGSPMAVPGSPLRALSPRTFLKAVSYDSHTAPLICALCLRFHSSLPALLPWCPVSWKPSFYIFCLKPF